MAVKSYQSNTISAKPKAEQCCDECYDKGDQLEKKSLIFLNILPSDCIYTLCKRQATHLQAIQIC